MSNARTLVVSQNYLDELRQGLVDMAMFSPLDAEIYEHQIATIDQVIKAGVTVDMDTSRVATLARVVSQIPETPWQRREREQFYSEADSVDADWTPSGGAA